MLPEQHDILWSFLAISFTVFALYAFFNVIRHCREREDVSTPLWGTVFGAFLLTVFWETIHMFDLIQGDQIIFFFKYQITTVFLLLLTWGRFFKSEKIQDQSPPIIRGFFFWTTVSVLLAGYTNWLPQQRSDPPPKGGAEISSDITMEEYAEMGRLIVFGSSQVAGQKAIGKGQCPLCHTFEPGNDIGRCPNLFGVEDRSHSRIKEDRYLNEPFKVDEEDPATHVLKGRPGAIEAAYRRAGAGDEMTGEDYIRESMMCPSCYVVKGFGKAGDKKSPMPVITKPPISLSPIEVNAVIAWLQSKDTPGEFAKVTVPLPSADATAAEEPASGEEEDAPIFVTGTESMDEMINTLGCPLCHTIPGIEGAFGELGPKLHEKINAPNRIKDPRYKGKASNTKEYVRESILAPSAYVVFNEVEGELFPDGLMPPDFKNKLSIEALDKLVDFISQTEG